MAASERIAVFGAGGTMGLPIARNLAQAGFDVRAWNRTAEKARPLKQHGVNVLDDPAAAARDATVLITMLSDADAVLQAVTANGVLESLAQDALWLQTSTIGIEGIECCDLLAREHGIALVDAPVLGTKKPAEEGKLVVLASGAGELQARARPIFDAIGQRTMWIGETGAGTRLKLVTNGWIVSVVEGAAESLALAEGLGLDPRLLLQAVEGGPLDLPYLRMKAEAIAERDFAPSFRLALAAKDAGLVEAAARRHGLDLPVLAAIRERLEEGVRRHGDDDMSATFLTSAPTEVHA